MHFSRNNWASTIQHYNLKYNLFELYLYGGFFWNNSCRRFARSPDSYSYFKRLNVRWGYWNSRSFLSSL